MKKNKKFNTKRPRRNQKPSSLSGSMKPLPDALSVDPSSEKSEKGLSTTDGSKPPKKESVLEKKFRLLWGTFSGPDLVQEHRFHPVRKWRFDFAHLESKVAVELQGGIWSGGRHGRGYGIVGDYEKLNESQFYGWDVIQLSAKQITTENIEKIVSLIKSR